VCVVGCFGEYDFVSITDYPNEAAALKAVGYADFHFFSRSIHRRANGLNSDGTDHGVAPEKIKRLIRRCS
jgi:hypothetical protein